jgi:hypothetical protein
MGSTREFWDVLAGKERPTEIDGQARAEARCFSACLRLGKMSLREVCETIRISENEAEELSAFVRVHPEEGIIVESAIAFRSLVAKKLEDLLNGGNNVFPNKGSELAALDLAGRDGCDDLAGIV